MNSIHVIMQQLNIVQCLHIQYVKMLSMVSGLSVWELGTSIVYMYTGWLGDGLRA